jgi:hypothetical protein
VLDRTRTIVLTNSRIMLAQTLNFFEGFNFRKFIFLCYRHSTDLSACRQAARPARSLAPMFLRGCGVPARAAARRPGLVFAAILLCFPENIQGSHFSLSLITRGKVLKFISVVHETIRSILFSRSIEIIFLNRR